MKTGRPKLPPGQKKEQVWANLDPRTLKDLDAYCEERGLKRNEAVYQLVREALGGIYRVS